jgi:uncharacterized protein YndB with AHSA1/START domain
MQSTVTRSVSMPPSVVWAVLSDHEAMAGWAPGLKVRLEKEGRDTRDGVGAVRRISAPLPLPAIVEEVTAFEPDERLAYRALAGVPLKNYWGEIVLRPRAGGTAISYTVGADERVPLLDRSLTRVIATALASALVRAVKKAR